MTTPHGNNLIAGRLVGSPQGFAATSPLDGRELPGRFSLASLDDAAAAMQAAEAAAEPLAGTTGEARGAFLERIADEIMALGDALIEWAGLETALPAARLTGERLRTVNQFKLFAAQARDGAWMDPRIDRAQPDRQPLPRPDLRRAKRPLGPVVVLGRATFRPPSRWSGATRQARCARAIPSSCPTHCCRPRSRIRPRSAWSGSSTGCGRSRRSGDAVFASRKPPHGHAPITIRPRWPDFALTRGTTMHHRRHPLSSIVVVALGLASGWLAVSAVAVGADGAEGFTLYAPSGAERRLLVVRARPAGSGVALEIVRTVDLGFSGGTITAHATRPLLYVSGGRGKEGHNAAVVPLDEAGLPQELEPVTLDRGYASLSTDRAGRFLLGCDYGSGAVDVYPLDADGLPGKRVHGRDEGRKLAHCVLPSPDNRFVYIPYVKETNALYQYAFDPATGALAPLDPLDVGPPAGSGPRHLVYHPRLPLVYFSEEQGLGVSIYKRAEDGRLSLWQRSRAVPTDAPASGVTSSDIVLTPDGRHLYAGIRGHEHAFDFIACYAVRDDGSLAPRGLVPADKIPWGMAVSPDGRFLAVTGFESATLMLYAIAADGSLTRAATLAIDKQIADLLAR